MSAPLTRQELARIAAVRKLTREERITAGRDPKFAGHSTHRLLDALLHVMSGPHSRVSLSRVMKLKKTHQAQRWLDAMHIRKLVYIVRWAPRGNAVYAFMDPMRPRADAPRPERKK